MNDPGPIRLDGRDPAQQLVAQALETLPPHAADQLRTALADGNPIRLEPVPTEVALAVWVGPVMVGIGETETLAPELGSAERPV